MEMQNNSPIRQGKNYKNWDEFYKARLAPFQWKKGQSGNPKGRPALSKELNDIKNAALERCVKTLHSCVDDPVYMASLDPDQVIKFLELVYDRFGLPKVVKSEVKETGNKLIILRAAKGENA